MHETALPDSTLWEIHPSARGTTHSATAPQHHRLVAPLHTGTGESRLTLRIDGPVDAVRLRTATQQVLHGHPALLRRPHRAANGPQVFTAAGTSLEPDPLRHGTVPLARLHIDDHKRRILELCPARGAVDANGLLRAAAAIADAYTTGMPPPVNGRPAPEEVDALFADLLTEPDGRTGVEFWRQHHGAAVGEVFRALAMRPSRPGRRRHLPVLLNQQTQRGLICLTKATGVPVSTVVLTAWRLLLGRIAPGESGPLALFTPGPLDQLPHNVGLLGRYVPIPAITGGTGRSLLDVLRSTQDEVTAAQEHGEFFSHDSEDDFGVGFGHVDAPGELSFGPAARAVVLSVDAPVDQIALDVRSMLRGDELTLFVDADSAVVAPDVVERVTEWLERLLIGMSDRHAPGMTTSEVADLPADASRLIGSARVTAEDTLIEAFDACAAQSPGAPAAADDRTRISYGALQAASVVLAERLERHGVREGDRVGVLMTRRTPLMAALLGVMRSGACYVPLDPSLPGDRVVDLLRDSGSRVVLVDTDTISLLDEQGVDVPPLLRADDLPLHAFAPHRAPSRARPLQQAYLIYTSGSTGSAKGVRVTHRALLHYLRWAAEHYGTAEGTGTVVHSSLAADLTVTSLFLPLLTGALVTLVPSDDPQALAEVVAEACGLSLLKVTPSGLRLLSELLTGDQIAQAARHLVVGGEQLAAQAWQWLNVPGLAVTNEYGPTEATVGCTAYTFRTGTPVPDPVPIGQPVWNTTIELRTPGRDELVLPGSAGEIVVVGPQVAEGYHNRPDETAARFIVDASGARAYRTGDLARLRPDGQLEMLGRIDEQVKVHGYRVEPGEIEAVLVSDVQIDQAAVIASRPGDGAQPVLTAFLVGASSASAETVVRRAEELAARRLPFYARPDRFQVLPELPLQPGGKVDRRALANRRDVPEPRSGEDLDSGDPDVAALVGLWADVLGRPPLTRGTNFFAEGGDSLKAVYLASRAQRAGLTLTVHDVLRARTFGRMAGIVCGTGGRPTAAEVSPGPILLSANQAAVLTTRAVSPAWTLRYHAQAPYPVVDEARLREALNATLRSHPALASSFIRTGSGWSTRLLPAARCPLLIIDLTDRQPGEHDRIVLDSLAQAEKDLCLTGPLASLVLIRDGARTPPRVGWIVHHLVADLVSLQVLIEDLWHAYDHPAIPVPARDDGYLNWLKTKADQPAPVLPTGAWTAVAPVTTSADLGSAAYDVLATAGTSAAHWPVAILAGALIGAVSELRPDLPAGVSVELHGRDVPGHDLAATVGWLTAFRALRVDRSLLTDVPRLIGALHDQLGRAAATTGPLPPVALNYLGELPPGGTLSLDTAGSGTPLFPLEAVCFTRSGAFEVHWRVCPAWMPTTTLAHLAEAFSGRVRTPVPHLDASGLATDDLARIAAIFGESS